MNSDRKFLKPKKGMTFDTGKMHNKRNNENKIAVTHIDRIQDSPSAKKKFLRESFLRNNEKKTIDKVTKFT